MGKNKIRWRMVLLIFITLIPLSILEWTGLKSDFNSMVEMEIKSNKEYAEVIKVSFMNYLDRTWANQFVMGKVLTSHPHWQKENIENYLKSVMLENEVDPQYSWISPKGTVIVSTDNSLIDKSLLDRKYIQRILQGEDKVISDLRTAGSGKEMIIVVARAIRSEGELKGIITKAIDVSKIQNILPIEGLSKGSAFTLIDNNATVVYKSDLSDIPYEKRLIKENSPAGKALDGEIVKTYGNICIFDGKEKIGVDYPIGEIGWTCFVTSSKDAVLADSIKKRDKQLIVFLCVHIISFLGAVYVGNEFIKSLDKIKDESHEIEEYNKSKAEFLSTMSHELKTPLNIILGCVQLMENLDFNDISYKQNFNKYIKMQKQNSYRLLRLINNFIDVNKAEVNNIKLNCTRGDIVKVIEDITMSVVEYTKFKNIEIIFDTEIEERVIAFDGDIMERIMLNLLSNAIKFTASGGIIEVNIYNEEDKVIISIKDNGVGIPEDKLLTIFERFSQVDNTLRRKSEGSGIGLSLVKYLVELQGGKITVKSEVGRGSEFLVELPAKIIENEKLTTYLMDDRYVERINIEFSDIYM